MNATEIKTEDSGAYLPFYFEWMDIIDDLPMEDIGKLLTAFIQYARGNEVTVEIPPTARHAYLFITSTIRRSEINRKNGRKGGLARARKASVLPTKASESNEMQDNSTTNKAEKSDIRTDSPTSKNFEPPSREEVQKLFRERGYSSDPNEFYSHHAAVGWKRGEVQITEWEAAAESWELRYKKAATVAQEPTQMPPLPTASPPISAYSSDSSSRYLPKRSEPQKLRYGTFDATEAFLRNVELTLREAKEIDDDILLKK